MQRLKPTEMKTEIIWQRSKRLGGDKTMLYIDGFIPITDYIMYVGEEFSVDYTVFDADRKILKIYVSN